MNRLKDNLELLKIIEIYIKNNPDIRFIQALWALNIIDSKIIDGPAHEIYVPVDRFYEEPNETLKRIDMKNYKLWKVGDMCKIVRTHGDDLGKIGKIVEVRPSFCKIEIEGYKKPLNHTYGQFVKINEEEITNNE